MLKDWLTHMQAIALFHNAAGQYRKSKDCFANGKYGEEIGRLQVADAFIKKALEFHKSLPSNILNEFKVHKPNYFKLLVELN